MGSPLTGKPLVQLEASFPAGQRCFEALLTCYIHEAFLVSNGRYQVEALAKDGAARLKSVPAVDSSLLCSRLPFDSYGRRL